MDKLEYDASFLTHGWRLFKAITGNKENKAKRWQTEAVYSLLA